VEASNGGLTKKMHAEHHAVFQAWLERENRRAEFREKVKAQVGGWGIITLLTACGYMVWHGFLVLLKSKGGQ
jgi:hypothetical protein